MPSIVVKTRILLVDDHVLVRDGIAAYLQLEESIEVVGYAENGLIAIEKSKELQPDIVLMDIGMPVMGGLEATAILSKEAPEINVLILSMHDEPEYILKLMQAGASGYVLKDVSFDELLKAIKIIDEGKTYFSVTASKQQFSNLVPTAESSPLTARESVVLSHIANGLSNKSTAQQLNISIRTVETHRQNIKQKIGVTTTAGLTKYALEHGLI
ncbi:MAG: response regulator transcription factor [Cocleimonas sp.]|nr:response regulator transcription factor [Cocleimonas sp.]